MKSFNPVVEKSFEFSIRIVKCYKYLIKKDTALRSLYNQLLDSGTSIGANISESQAAASKTDFRNKLRISLKEAYETEYWLKLFFKTEILEEKEYKSLLQNCLEIIRLLTSIIKNVKVI
ncbi:MAG: four helix bundle protein [Ignavibacteriales bacterium]|nr:MAG: four helix bundle protein [Ignavibacteriales bacterium]